MPDYSDVAAVIDRAKAMGVQKCIIPGIDLPNLKKAVNLAETFDDVYFAVGLHPSSEEEEISEFISSAQHPKCVAIGEIGLDSKAGPVENQEPRFRQFLDLAAEYDKPVILHIRDHFSDVWRVVADYPTLKNRCVVHCFTGGHDEATEMTRLGIWMSVTAILARKSTSSETLEAVKSWPLENMMLETDGPWLPFPGEPYPNEPTTIAKIAQFIANLKGTSVEEVARTTTQTAEQFFGI